MRHRELGDHARRSGMPGRIANLVFDMYKGSRHTRAHGAVARARHGSWGLVAGCFCLFETHAEPLRQCPIGRPRGYVGDITLYIDDGDPEECAAQMEGELERSNGRRQYGLERREAASSGDHEGGPPRLRSQGGTAVEVAKDLRISHYGYGGTHPELSGDIHAPQTAARRICLTGGAQRARCNVAASLLFGRCLYGAECHYHRAAVCEHAPGYVHFQWGERRLSPALSSRRQQVGTRGVLDVALGQALTEGSRGLRHR